MTCKAEKPRVTLVPVFFSPFRHNRARVRPSGRPRLTSPFSFALLTGFALAAYILVIAGCSNSASNYLVGDASRRRELASLFRILETHSPHGDKPDSLAHFAAARAISATLVHEGYPARAAAFLTNLAEASDDYSAWYLFAAAASYESAGDIELAIPLYERMVKTLPDLSVDGKSLHFEALTRLVSSSSPPQRKIEYYRDLIARFPDSPDLGSYRFLLAKEYEKAGAWKEALGEYAAFLPYFGVSVPGHPDALAYARQLVEFNASPKNWSKASLDELVGEIRTALRAGSARQLRKNASKAGFFAVSWYQDSDEDANSKVAFDLAQFIQGRPIQSADALHPSSGPREAYLRTWGWTGRVPVWYLYFRKINFPADPAVHGQWEWAGIYFGEKMR